MTMKTIGARIDEIMKLQAQLDKHEARLVPLREAIAAKREALFKSTKKQDLNGATGALGRATVKDGATVPQLQDPAKFLKYVLAKPKERGDLLKSGVSSAAWRERLEAKIAVPGVVPFKTPPVLQLTALRRR